MPLPATERVLLGPGPSLIAPRVMRALAAPVLSHLDPDFVPLLDDVRASLQRVFRADSKSLTLATSGTGTSAMEAAVANVVSDGMRGVVIVTGYFGDRLAQIFDAVRCARRRIDVEWGRAWIRSGSRRTVARRRRCGRHRPCRDIHRRTESGEGAGGNRARERGADDRRYGDVAGRSGVDLAGWGVTWPTRAARSALAHLRVSRRGRVGRRARTTVKCRSFYLDLRLLEDYWLGRKYHHTMCTSLIYALREALQMVEEEGLPASRLGTSVITWRWRLVWTPWACRFCHRRRAAVDVEHDPRADRVDEAAIRKTLLTTYNIEVGAGLGPLAGKIWRVGLMGASSTPQTLLQFLAALEAALATHGHRVPEGAGVAAAGAALRPAMAGA
jgi:alanine-glyoxylate transaminase/serine-glyoxylate transaminase/serine-pyruvate transaminase